MRRIAHDRFESAALSKWGALSVFTTCFFVGAVPAEIIFESAVSGPTQQTGGSGVLIGSDSYVAVNFALTETVVTGSIGGHFTNFDDGAPIFGAIVRVDGEFDFVSVADFTSPKLLGATQIPLVRPSDNLSGNLRLTLEPGWYALIFGSARFGATGEGGTFDNNIPDGTSRIYTLKPSTGEILIQASDARLFVESEPIPRLEVIVDTESTLVVDDDPTSFSRLEAPSVSRQRNLAWVGTPFRDALYKTIDGVTTTVARASLTLIPGTSDSFQLIESRSAIDSASVAFYGGIFNSLTGLYTDVRGQLERVIDTTMSVPGGTDPFVFPQFSQFSSIEQGAITFFGRNETSSAGVYKWQDGEIHVVASPGTPIPNGNGFFEVFDELLAPMENGVIAFSGDSVTDGSSGIYRTGPDGLEVVYDNSVPLPAVGFVDRIGAFHMRDGKFAFVGMTDGFTELGIFTDADGPLTAVAKFGTPVPDGTGTFTLFFIPPMFDGRHVAFNAGNEELIQGIYTTILGRLAPIVIEGTELLGTTITSFALNPGAIQDNKVFFKARLENGGSAIVKASYPAPPGDVTDDGFVDLRDFARLSFCFSGSFSPSDGAACDDADFNGDTDVDLGDYRSWFECLSGPDVKSACGY